MTKLIALFLLLSLSAACIKTAEQVQREKRFENMTEQMADSQSLIADMVSQMKDMQSQLDKLNGRIEELEHRQRQVDPAALKKMNEDLTVLREHEGARSEQLAQIQNELKEQRAFLEKVTTTLSSMGKSSGSKGKKKSAKEELNEALELVRKNEYSAARTELLTLLDSKDLTPGEHNKALHGLGRVEFYTKNYDKALVYFSKIYTKYPKSSLAPNSLFLIAKSLQKLGKKDEAKEAFAKLTEDYPGAREAQEAKKEL